MFITSTNTVLKNTDRIFFEDTSVHLSTSKNIFLVSDTELASLKIRFDDANDTYSEDFKLYELDRIIYTINIEETLNAFQNTIVYKGYSINVASNDSVNDIANKLQAAMIAAEDFSSVIVDSNKLVIKPRQSGNDVDVFLTEGFEEVGSFSFDISLTEPDDFIKLVDELNLGNVDFFKRSGKFVYKINTLFTPEYEKGTQAGNYDYDHYSKLLVEYENDEGIHDYEFNLFGNCKHIDGQLTIALQNFKKHISEDYYQAFADSKLNTNEQDQVLLNRKKREYLMVILDLTGFVGSYRSLLAAVEYFGWGDLLDLKEYWKSMSSNKYKLTSVKNQVLDKVEKQLIGYRKSNQMSLTYSINAFNGQLDEDGLPIYENVLEDTDTVITKLYSLKRVLECDFLTLNTKIIDITGEINAVVGHELNIWINDAVMTKINLNENVNSSIDWSFEDEVINIEEHEVLVNPFIYEVDSLVSETIKFIEPVPDSAKFDKEFFHINEKVDSSTGGAELLYATTYLREDFGMIQVNVTEISTELYQSFQYMIYEFDSSTELFKSDRLPIRDLKDSILMGVRRLGEFRVVIAFFDHYGGMSIVGKDDKIVVQNSPIDFRIARHSVIPEESFVKDLRLLSTFEDLVDTDTDRSFVVDAISETLDVNNYNQLTNLPVHSVLKKYENIFDKDQTYTLVNELNSIDVNRMNGLPVSIWGYKYGTAVYDIMGNYGDGVRRIKMKLFEHHEWSEVSMDHVYSDYNYDEEFITAFIELLNGQPKDSIFRRFTYDLNYYSNDPLGHLNDVRPMLRIKARDESMLISDFKIEVETSFAVDDFIECIDLADILVYSTVDTMNTIFPKKGQIQGSVITSFTDPQVNDVSFNDSGIVVSRSSNAVTSTGQSTELVVRVGEKELITTGHFYDIDNLIFALESWKLTEGITTLSFWENDGALTISCQEDFYLKNADLGHHEDIFRGSKGTQLVYAQSGDDFKIAEPVYAFVNNFSKINSANVTWTLTNSLTGEIIVQQYAQAFRYVITKRGSYTLSCESTDRYGTTVTTKPGVYLIDAL